MASKKDWKATFLSGRHVREYCKKKKKKVENSASHWGLHHHTPGFTDDSALGHHAELSGRLFVLRVSKNAREHLPVLSRSINGPAVLLNIKPSSTQCWIVRPNWLLICKYRQDKRFTGGTYVNTRFSIHTSSTTANYRCAIHAKPAAAILNLHEACCEQIAHIISSLPYWIGFFFCVLCMRSDSTSIPDRLQSWKWSVIIHVVIPLCVGHRRFVSRQTAAMPADDADIPWATTWKQFFNSFYTLCSY